MKTDIHISVFVDESEGYFKRSLEIDPEDIATLNNYALFQKDIRTNYTFAAELLERALLIDDEVTSRPALCCVHACVCAYVLACLRACRHK